MILSLRCDLARGIYYRDPNICDPRSHSHTHEDTAILLGALIREPGQNLEHLRRTMRRLGGYQQVYGFTAEIIEGDPETGGLLAHNPGSGLYYPSMRGLRCYLQEPELRRRIDRDQSPLPSTTRYFDSRDGRVRVIPLSAFAIGQT
jgi:hypothetical protein